MAFNLQNFQFARGVDSSYAQGQGVTTIQHTYKSETDTRATIAGVNYFPPFIGGDADKVFVNDSLFIAASDGASLCVITSVNPVVLGPDLLVSGPTLSMAAPIAPVDANGARISGNILQMEYASAAFPGSVSINNQTFAGIKAFQDGINVFGNGVLADQINATGASPLLLGNVLTTEVDVVPILNLGVAGLTINSGTAITNYKETTGSFTWSGAFTVPQTVNFYLTQTNTHTTLMIKGMAAPAAAGAVAAFADSGVFIPAGYRPAADTQAFVIATNNGTAVASFALVKVAGNVQVFSNPTSALFGNAGNNQIGNISITYSIV